MRLLLVPALLALFFICSRSSTGFVCSAASKDRMACVPHGVTTIQTVRVIKKYLADNSGKAPRATRYIASIALAGAFPCRAGR